MRLLSSSSFVLLITLSTSSAFTISPASPTTATKLYAQKQTRSSLLKPPKQKKEEKKRNAQNNDNNNDGGSTEEEVFGTKFFGGSAVKEELFDAELEEQADKMLKLYPPKSKKTIVLEREDKKDIDNESNDEDSNTYHRFMDTNSFPDDAARSLAQRLQSSINSALYENNDDATSSSGNGIYSSTLQWNTPFSKNKASRTPLDELNNALEFYKRIDIAIIAAKSLNASGSSSSNNKVQQMEVKWETSLVWPNIFESRVLVTGTSKITVDTTTSTILSQTDALDTGGKDGTDIIKAINSQLQPRFWDLYHVGMTPSAELMPRVTPTNTNHKKGFLSSYDVFELPSRLVLQPTIIDSGGRDTREAQALPNHAFTSIIKTTGPTGQRYVTTSPVEVSICREPKKDGSGSQSIISWNIPLPPEFISNYDELTKIVTDEDKEEGNDPTTNYSYQPRRLVATLPYGGNAQDVEVTEIRKKLYESVVKDGLKPKLGEGGRPQFFFLQNEAKACFTADGGLGMAVYEWRPKAANSNEVGIELEL